MKKNFPLTAKDKSPDEVLKAVKHEIRKYLKREDRKPLPKGMDYWRFHCEFGKSKGDTTEIEFPEIFKKIDAAAAEGAPSFYLILLSSAIKRSDTEKK